MVCGAGTQQHGDRNPHDNWEQDAWVTAAGQVRRETGPDWSSMTQELDVVLYAAFFLLMNLLKAVSHQNKKVHQAGDPKTGNPNRNWQFKDDSQCRVKFSGRTSLEKKVSVCVCTDRLTDEIGPWMKYFN